jgi:hypothetical protein
MGGDGPKYEWHHADTNQDMDQVSPLRLTEYSHGAG